MAFPSVPTSSSMPHTGSQYEVDGPLSPRQVAKLSVSKLPHLMVFAQNLRMSLDSLIVKKHYGHYDSVHVLLLTWRVSEDSPIKELTNLDRFFKDDLSFTTEHYQIPCDDTEDEFNSKLEDVIRAYGGLEDLLIIYYAGHSRMDLAQGITFWQSHTTYPSGELEWSTIENRLNNTIAPYSNILYILDSGYTPSGLPSNFSGSKELLAAAKNEPKSATIEENQVTGDPLHELQQRFQAFGSVSFQILHSLTSQRQSDRYSRNPYYLALTNQASDSSIVLAPMRADSPREPIPLAYSRSVTLCMIQAKVSSVGNPATWWATNISDSSQLVENRGIQLHPAGYVKYYESRVFDEVHYILVSMPTEVARKISKETFCGRAFMELGMFGSEASITKAYQHEAFRLARLPRSGLIGWFW